jgi:hypothetical protein
MARLAADWGKRRGIGSPRRWLMRLGMVGGACEPREMRAGWIAESPWSPRRRLMRSATLAVGVFDLPQPIGGSQCLALHRATGIGHHQVELAAGQRFCSAAGSTSEAFGSALFEKPVRPTGSCPKLRCSGPGFSLVCSTGPAQSRCPAWNLRRRLGEAAMTVAIPMCHVPRRVVGEGS